DAQRFIQSVLSSISDTLIVCDVNGYIMQVNDSLTEVIGKPSKELVGTPLSSLIDEDYQMAIAEFPDHIRSGSIIDCEVDFKNSSGMPIPMAVNCSARFDHKNRLSGFVVTGRPLGELRKAYSDLQQAHEELKNAQQQLIQSEKLASLGRLVAGVAHELNNPISFLYANMHALQSYENKFRVYIDAIHNGANKTEQEKLREELKIDNMMSDITPLVEGSLEGAERVSDIVQNLRKFATPQEGGRERFDLVHVIRRATSWVLKAATIKPEIITDYPESLLLYNSEGHVHQILINLIQNALDAIADSNKPQLKLGIEVKDRLVNVSIKDNGPGIAQADIVKIFDPFFTTKDVGSGTGLGLYISYGLATEQCHGSLKVLSPDNKGAEFILSLPLDTSAGEGEGK
ncbi:MAG TPA: PAS domain S-box protein, partial [Thiotrichales bacterium]|nr:PAS domain S-box protein [Thiotrichales bacterium]